LLAASNQFLLHQPLILSIDIGTSSVRAALYDANADLVPRMSVKFEYSFTAIADGGFEIDADVLLGHVTDAIDLVLKKSSRLKVEIGYVASCAFWHSLVGVDDRGKTTTSVLGWADRRSREYTTVLKERFDETETHNRTGAHFHSSFWPAKLLWLRKKNRAVFENTNRWLSFADYVSFHLTRSVSTSISMASATGIFDQQKSDWNPELLRYLKIKRSQLPEINGEERFNLAPNFARRWPRLKHSEWFPTIGDGAADNIGSGCLTKNKAALMVGTSAAMRVAYRGDAPANIPDGLWCYRIDRERVIIGGALSDGGNLYQWLKHRLHLPKNAEDEMRRRGAAAHGLTLMPFFFGERSTGYNESAKGSIAGLTSSHNAVDILQAAMESVAYRFAEIHDRLKTVASIKEIAASGGGLRDSPVWTQIIADVLGRDLLINDTQESSSRGAVLLALESVGKIENIEKLAAPHSTILAHHPKCHAVYKQAREQHHAAYKKCNEER